MTEADQREIFSKNLRNLLHLQRLSQKEVADAIGVIPQTFNRWVQGLSLPRMDKVQKLADYFNVRKSALIDPLPIEDENVQATKPQNGKPLHLQNTTAVRIPVLGDVAAGIPISAIEDILDYEEIPERLARTGEYFGLRIQGDSMEPRICESDVVVVRQQPDADTGDIVIVRIDHERVTCKRLRKYADGALELVSLNPSYEPMFFDRAAVENEPVEIVGVVVENRQKFKMV